MIKYFIGNNGRFYRRNKYKQQWVNFMIKNIFKHLNNLECSKSQIDFLARLL